MRTEGGKVACWGDNVDRQVAPIDTPEVDAPRWLDVPPSASVRCDSRQTCVRTAVGDVYCLGGSLEIGKVALPEPAIDLTVHRGGGCALLASGHPWCWSQLPPLETQLPQPQPSSQSVAAAPAFAAARTPWAVPGAPVLTRFLAAPALSRAVCGDTASGPVCIRGAELPDTVSVSTADDALRGAISIAVGKQGDTLCGVLPDHTLRCTGEGKPNELTDTAQLRVSVASEAHRAAPPLAAYDGGLCFAAQGAAWRCAGAENALGRAIPKDASAVSLGADHACAIRDGTVACWGAASRGQLGAGSYLHAAALEVPGIEDAVDLDVGGAQACVVRRTGGVSCWGALSRHGAAVDVVFAPRALPVSQPILEVRAAHRGAEGTAEELQQQTTCTRSAAGWSCWERDAFRRARPLDATPLRQWKVSAAQVSPDGQCAVTSKGALVCAGEPSFTSTNRSLRTALLRFESDVPFAEASSSFSVAGQLHVCARTVSGKVRCYAALSAMTSSSIATPGLAELGDIVGISASGLGDDGAVCALARSGTVFCWGEGRWSQVPGTGPRSPWEPVAVAGLPPVAEIGVGGAFACARTESGKVFCWGSNRLGTAPNGLPGASAEPVTVEGL